jgi:hypothetical protein
LRRDQLPATSELVLMFLEEVAVWSLVILCLLLVIVVIWRGDGPPKIER